jgi:hypothetical protein
MENEGSGADSRRSRARARTAAFLFALSLLVPGGARATTRDEAAAASDEEGPPAALEAREGQLTPQTLSAVIGHKQIIALMVGGFDAAPDRGIVFNAGVEGELWHRVALEVGLEYAGDIQAVYRSLGVRVSLLRQEPHKLDLGLVGEYRSLAHVPGTFELGLLAGRRWRRLGLQANALYGQGLDPGERDVELRAALLFFVRPRLNVGIDLRGRFDLSRKSAESKLELIACALGQLTVGDHVVLIAELGQHVVAVPAGPSLGAVVLAGVAVTF